MSHRGRKVIHQTRVYKEFGSIKLVAKESKNHKQFYPTYQSNNPIREIISRLIKKYIVFMYNNEFFLIVGLHILVDLGQILHLFERNLVEGQQQVCLMGRNPLQLL